MLNGLFPARRRRSGRGWHGVILNLGLALLFTLPQVGAAQAPGKNEGQTKQARPKTDDEDRGAPDAKKVAGPENKADDDGADESGQLAKIIPYEIFRDPKAEKLLGVDNYPQL